MRRDALHSVQDAGRATYARIMVAPPLRSMAAREASRHRQIPGRRASPTIVRQPERHRMAVAVPDGDDTVRGSTGLWQEIPGPAGDVLPGFVGRDIASTYDLGLGRNHLAGRARQTGVLL